MANSAYEDLKALTEGQEWELEKVDEVAVGLEVLSQLLIKISQSDGFRGETGEASRTLLESTSRDFSDASGQVARLSAVVRQANDYRATIPTMLDKVETTASEAELKFFDKVKDALDKDDLAAQHRSEVREAEAQRYMAEVETEMAEKQRALAQAIVDVKLLSSGSIKDSELVVQDPVWPGPGRKSSYVNVSTGGSTGGSSWSSSGSGPTSTFAESTTGGAPGGVSVDSGMAGSAVLGGFGSSGLAGGALGGSALAATHLGSTSGLAGGLGAATGAGVGGSASGRGLSPAIGTRPTSGTMGGAPASGSSTGGKPGRSGGLNGGLHSAARNASGMLGGGGAGGTGSSTSGVRPTRGRGLSRPTIDLSDFDDDAPRPARSPGAGPGSRTETTGSTRNTMTGGAPQTSSTSEKDKKRRQLGIDAPYLEDDDDYYRPLPPAAGPGSR